MEGSRKKPVMLGVIFVCLSTAGVVTYMTMPEGPGQPRSYLLKCKNPDCGAEYKIGSGEYTGFAREHIDTKTDNPTGMACKKCGKETAYRIVKCDKCGEVFFYHYDGKDFADRCPKCGCSKVEDDWKRKTAQ